MERCERTMTELEGKWKLQHEKNDNFEEYMKAVGIALPFRKMGKKLTPVEEIKKIDNTRWSLDLSVAIRHSRVEFELGQAIDEITLDGRPCKTWEAVGTGIKAVRKYILQEK